MSTVDKQQLVDYLIRQRWYTGTGEATTVTEIHPLGWLSRPTSGLGVRVVLASVSDGRGTQLYNLPLAYRLDPAQGLQHALIGIAVVDGQDYLVYDALHDSDAVRVLLQGFANEATSVAGLEYVRTEEFDLGPEPVSVMLSVEQSNTSVIIDDISMMKFFRRVSPGRNPDVEVLAALSADYSDTVPKLQGWLSTASTPELGSCDLAILQHFLRTATEGWESARASVRDLLAQTEIPVDEVGGDFAGESERLGAATRHVHLGMAALLPTGSWGPQELTDLADRLQDRFEEAADMVPVLEEHRVAVTAVYDALRSLQGPVSVHRIHGDLHLGQTLRTSVGWKLIDFEGEPGRPLSERSWLDSPMRDIAGMLRSFDYAAQSVLVQVGVTEEGELATREWSSRNQEAFLRGYGVPDSSDDAVLLRAYTVGKTVYEVVYETLHRPTWVHIPLRALP